MLLKAFKRLFIWQVFMRYLLFFRDWHLQVSPFILSAVFMEHSLSARHHELYWVLFGESKAWFLYLWGSQPVEKCTFWLLVSMGKPYSKHSWSPAPLLPSPQVGRMTYLPGWFGSNSPLCGAKCSKIPHRWRTIGSALFLHGLNQQKHPVDWMRML